MRRDDGSTAERRKGGAGKGQAETVKRPKSVKTVQRLSVWATVRRQQPEAVKAECGVDKGSLKAWRKA